jgi:hypothetical protein
MSWTARLRDDLGRGNTGRSGRKLMLGEGGNDENMTDIRNGKKNL